MYFTERNVFKFADKLAVAGGGDGYWWLLMSTVISQESVRACTVSHPSTMCQFALPAGIRCLHRERGRGAPLAQSAAASARPLACVPASLPPCLPACPPAPALPYMHTMREGNRDTLYFTRVQNTTPNASTASVQLYNCIIKCISTL